MSVLSICHTIYLNEENRYKLHAGVFVETVGFNLPVWMKDRQIVEPQQEIFCNYLLTNFGQKQSVELQNDRYVINLPDEKHFTEFLADIPCDPLNSKRLLNPKDDGFGTINFQFTDKVTINEKDYKVVHFVDIKDYSYFYENSLVLQKLGWAIS